MLFLKKIMYLFLLASVSPTPLIAATEDTALAYTPIHIPEGVASFPLDATMANLIVNHIAREQAKIGDGAAIEEFLLTPQAAIEAFYHIEQTDPASIIAFNGVISALLEPELARERDEDASRSWLAHATAAISAATVGDGLRSYYNKNDVVGIFKYYLKNPASFVSEADGWRFGATCIADFASSLFSSGFAHVSRPKINLVMALCKLHSIENRPPLEDAAASTAITNTNE